MESEVDFCLKWMTLGAHQKGWLWHGNTYFSWCFSEIIRKMPWKSLIIQYIFGFPFCCPFTVWHVTALCYANTFKNGSCSSSRTVYIYRYVHFKFEGRFFSASLVSLTPRRLRKNLPSISAMDRHKFWGATYVWSAPSTVESAFETSVGSFL